MEKLQFLLHIKSLQIFEYTGHTPYLRYSLFYINIPVCSQNFLLSFEQALTSGEMEALNTIWYSVIEAFFL